MHRQAGLPTRKVLLGLLAATRAFALAVAFGLSCPAAAEPSGPVESVDPAAGATPLLPASLTRGEAMKWLNTSCLECHGDEGDSFYLPDLETPESLVDQYDAWMRVRQQLAEHSMPPDYAEPVEMADRLRVVQWITGTCRNAILQEGEQAGPPLFRRLTRHEYSNTVRDLLDVHLDAGATLPQDLAGGEGFNNAAETLLISPIHSEKYLSAAETTLDYALSDSRARARMFPVDPGDMLSEDEAARENLRQLADSAYRRPVREQEVDGLYTLYSGARSAGLDFHQACSYAMRGVLTSPNFLFLAESAPRTPGVSEPLTDHELASRLSYFLWTSMPDEELRRAADAGRLTDSDELQRQTIRLIEQGDTHLNDSMVHFVGQWLGTDDWGRTKLPDPELYPWIEDHHIGPMRNQPVYIVESVLKENDSLLDLIDCDWTFINYEICTVIQVKREEFDKMFHMQPERRKLPEAHRYRGGLLGTPVVLAISAYPRRSSPVLRGAWVLDKLLGVDLPPPPPDVPPLEDTAAIAKTMTVRERLEAHRENPACAACHDRIDPIGFALEHFDELGRRRERDSGGPIDARATLPDGTEIEGLQGLKDYLLDNQDRFIRHLTEKMLGYALGRGLTPADMASVEHIVERVRDNDYRAQELVLGIVMSEPFRNKRAVN